MITAHVAGGALLLTHLGAVLGAPITATAATTAHRHEQRGDTNTPPTIAVDFEARSQHGDTYNPPNQARGLPVVARFVPAGRSGYGAVPGPPVPSAASGEAIADGGVKVKRAIGLSTRRSVNKGRSGYGAAPVTSVDASVESRGTDHGDVIKSRIASTVDEEKEDDGRFEDMEE